jgi:DnaJ-domain-containing protein 1
MKRVHILSTVNASNVSKTATEHGDFYIVSNVCGAVDDIIMNGVLYAGADLAKGAHTLTNCPAPIGHPKNAAGQYISANSADALLTAYAGAVCRNGRHRGGRTETDVEVNSRQALANPKGEKLVAWCAAAVNGEQPEPMHVSTGLVADMIPEAGERDGKKYTRRATNIRYDHLALLPEGRGAGTPEQGVGMFNDGTGDLQEVEVITINTEPEDKRTKGLMKWITRLLGNSSADLSHEEISTALYKSLPEGAWLRRVYDRYAIWTDRDGKLWKQDYSVSSDGASVAFSGSAAEVAEKVEYETVNQEGDTVKETILAALNAAGIATAGLDDAALLAAYNAHVSKPHKDALAATNSKLAAMELAANAAAEAELTTLATELAVNTSLKPEDFKAMGLERCKELKAANAKAAPVLPGAVNTGNAGDDPYLNYPDNPGFDPKEGK